MIKPDITIGNFEFKIIPNCNDECDECGRIEKDVGMLVMDVNDEYEGCFCSICWMSATAELLAIWSMK